MGWESKTDYCGLAIADKIICKSATENKTASYLEKLGSCGAVVATKVYGETASPSNEYTIKAQHSFAAGGIKLGGITTAGGKKFALSGFTYTSSAGAEPTFSGTAVQVEDTATSANSNYFEVPAFSITPEECATAPLAAATVSGANCVVTQYQLSGSATVAPHNVNGSAVASDVSRGKLELQITVGQYGEAAPTLAAAEGWDVSSPLTCTDPDSDYPTWTATLTKQLAKTQANAA